MGRFRHLIILACICVFGPGCPHDKKIPPPPAPDAPTGLILTALSPSVVQVDWTDVATNEDHYIVERSIDGTTFTRVALLPPGTTTYQDVGLQSGGTYFYQVTAINRGGTGMVGPDIVFTPDLQWSGPITGVGPGSRAHHSCIYDPVSQRMVMFGGANPGLQGDLWQLDLSDPNQIVTGDWSTLSAGVSLPPSPRAGHSAIYDAANKRMIVFGGQQTGPPASAYLFDVWVLTLGASPTWTPVTPLGTPPPGRRGHTAVYDPVRQEMVVFGGFDGNGPSIPTVYVLSLTPGIGTFLWTNPDQSNLNPGFRQWHTAVRDPATSQMFTFGGLDFDASDGTPLTAETWTLTSGSTYFWSPLTFGSTPPSRQGHTAVYDDFGQRMLMFGGGDYLFQPFAPPDLWALRMGSQPAWSILTPANPGPAKVQHHAAIYDSLNRRMVVYGGETATATYTDQVWWINP